MNARAIFEQGTQSTGHSMMKPKTGVRLCRVLQIWGMYITPFALLVALMTATLQAAVPLWPEKGWSHWHDVSNLTFIIDTNILNDAFKA